MDANQKGFKTQQSQPATKVVEVRIQVGPETVVVPVEELAGLDLFSPTGVPFPAVAVRRGDRLFRYIGFPVVIVDEVLRVEVPV